MEHHDDKAVDFGTGEKRLSIYLIGLAACVLLTLLAFWMVLSHYFESWTIKVESRRV